MDVAAFRRMREARDPNARHYVNSVSYLKTEIQPPRHQDTKKKLSGFVPLWLETSNA
jgi:hypothetical protein